MSRREKLEQMLEKEPDDAFLHFGLAMELVKEGQQDDAIGRFDRVLKIDPVSTAAFYHKGNTLIGLERLDDAKSALRAGIEAAKQISNAHAQREMEELLDSIA